MSPLVPLLAGLAVVLLVLSAVLGSPALALYGAGLVAVALVVLLLNRRHEQDSAAPQPEPDVRLVRRDEPVVPPSHAPVSPYAPLRVPPAAGQDSTPLRRQPLPPTPPARPAPFRRPLRDDDMSTTPYATGAYGGFTSDPGPSHGHHSSHDTSSDPGSSSSYSSGSDSSSSSGSDSGGGGGSD